MASVTLNKDNLIILRNCLEEIKSGGINQDVLYYFYNSFIPVNDNGELLSSFNIRTRGNVGMFIPSYNTVRFSLPYLKEVVSKNTFDMAEAFGVKNIEDLNAYMYIFYMMHEIEHVYQYLIANDKINAPYKEVRDGYKSVLSLFCKKDSLIPNPVGRCINLYHLSIYKQNEYIHILERNANLGASQIVLGMGNGNTSEDVIGCFDGLHACFESIGYHRDNKGAFNHTFRDIKLENRGKCIVAPDDMTLEDRLLYGFEIPEEQRRLVLKNEHKKTTYNK